MHQVLNPWLPGLFFINVKHRLLTIALNSMLIIFACLYWKSRGILCGLESGHPVWYIGVLLDIFLPGELVSFFPTTDVVKALMECSAHVQHVIRIL